MKLQRHELAEYIAKATQDVGDYDKLVREIAAYLLHENHTDELASLMRDVLRIRAQNGLVEATAVSAHKLSKDVVDDIHDLIKQEFPDATKTVVGERIEPDLVGGLLLKLPDEQLDLSVRRKLATFRHLTEAIKE